GQVRFGALRPRARALRRRVPRVRDAVMEQSPPHLSPLEAAYSAVLQYLQGLAGRRVGAEADAASMRAALGGPLPEQGEAPERVVEELARKADPGIVASAGPRFFGFVIGGSLPAAIGADWLTSAWDQNAGLFVLSPAAAIVEETVLQWLIELFGL